MLPLPQLRLRFPHGPMDHCFAEKGECGQQFFQNVDSQLRAGLSSFTPTTANFYDTYNRLNLTVGSSYDNAGNQTQQGGYAQQYDAEGHVNSSTVNSVSTTYYYDGGGRRVKKVSGGTTTVYVYDAQGQLAAEYASAMTGDSPCTTCYRVEDHLGSTRLVTDASGSVVSLHDFLPWGEEIPSGVGGRPATYGAWDVTQRFTGKERDAETGLDYFGARYYSGPQGRFTSPDPLMASARASNPQTWNRYAYTLNNPLRYVDRDGMDVPDQCAKDPNCTIKVKINVVYDQTVNSGNGLTDQQKAQFEQGQIAKAQKDYGTSNIKLDVTYRAGSYTVDQNTGQLQLAGIKSDSLNIVVSTGTPSGATGDSSVDRNTGTAITFLNFTEVHDRNAYPLFTNTTEHELAHQFLGDPYLPSPTGIGGFFQFLGHEGIVDSRVAGQATGISQEGFRVGLEPRRYAAPLNPEANKPQQ